LEEVEDPGVDAGVLLLELGDGEPGAGVSERLGVGGVLEEVEDPGVDAGVFLLELGDGEPGAGPPSKMSF
jgi:hypothetical protein